MNHVGASCSILRPASNSWPCESQLMGWGSHPAHTYRGAPQVWKASISPLRDVITGCPLPLQQRPLR